MVIAFKLNKIGSRYMPKPQRGKDAVATTRDHLIKADGSTISNGFKRKRDEGVLYPDQADPSNFGKDATCELEPSFAINLFLDGFSIGKHTEKGKTPPYGYELAENVCAYDRASDNLLRSIDSGWLPSDVLDDIPCTYVDGCVACELRDYRDTVPSTTSRPEAVTWIPKIHKITLRPSTETIVKDIAALADESWSYRDLVEVESRVLKMMNPILSLDPNPQVSAKAHAETYNRLKFNIGRSLSVYRAPKGANVDRRIRLSASRSIMRQESFSKRLKSPDKPETPGADTKSDLSVEIIQDSQLAVQSKHRSDAQLQRTSSGHQLPLSPSFSGSMGALSKVEANKRLKQEKPEKFQTPPPQPLQRNLPGLVDGKPVRQFQQFTQPLQQQPPDLQMVQADHKHVQEQKFTEDQKFQTDQQAGDFQLQQQRQWQMSNRKEWKQNPLYNKVPSPVTTSVPSPATALPDVANTIVLSPKQMQVPPGPLDHLQFNQSQGQASNFQQQYQVSNSQFAPQVQIQASQFPYARHRQNSFPGNMASPPANSPSTSSGVIRSPGPVLNQPQQSLPKPETKQNEPHTKCLLDLIHRHGLHKREKKVDKIEPPKNSQPSWQLLSVALADPNEEERKDPKGEKSLATYLVGGNVNARKTRFLQFERVYQTHGPQGHIFQHTTRQRLLLCGRGKDAMVEAVLQIGDDQDDDNAQHPYIVLPAIANADMADLFARQFIRQLKKENCELTEDNVQSSFPRQMNNNTGGRPVPAGSSSMAPQVGPAASSPRMLMNNQQMAQQMQQLHPTAMASARMPPPGIPGRQMSYGVPNTQMQQMNLPQAQQFQRPVMSPVNNSQAMYQMLQQQRQQQQQQQMQRKVALNNIGTQNIANIANMVGMPGMSNLQGLTVGQLSGLPGVQNMQMRPTQAQIAAFQKNRFGATAGRVRPGTTMGNIASQSQVQGLNPGLNMLAQRTGLRGPSPGMGPPRQQQYYMQFNPQQQQQFNQQMTQITHNQLQFSNQQQQQLTSQQLQAQLAMQPQPQNQVLGMQQQGNPNLQMQQQQQQQQQQQLSPQQLQQLGNVQPVLVNPSAGNVGNLAGGTPLPGTPVVGTPSMVGTPTMVGTPLVGTPQPQSPQVSSHSQNLGSAVPPGSPLEMQQQNQSQTQQQTSSSGVPPSVQVIQ